MKRVVLSRVSKAYRYFESPWDKVLEVLGGGKRHQDAVVLESLSLCIETSEVVGIIGVNGAGKSTLLKLIARTLEPSTGTVQITGRMCALLELGAGFLPEMTGRENVYLAAAIAGQARDETQRQFDAIVSFAGLGEAIDRPVKTYSSGMLIRLAFSVATSVDPDILILDEALSVGDGGFARKSFDRIMKFRDAGKTILFCSHSMYQVEAICTRVLWIDRGRLVMDGRPEDVVVAYNAFLDGAETDSHDAFPVMASEGPVHQDASAVRTRFLRIVALGYPSQDKVLGVEHGTSDLRFSLSFQSDPERNNPSIAMTMVGGGGRPIASASTQNDAFRVEVDASGQGQVQLRLPGIPLLKGRYWINFYLLCDRGIHVFDRAEYVYELLVTQQSSEIGIVSLSHDWSNCPGETPNG